MAMSTGLKVGIAAGGVLLLVLVLCAGGVALILWGGDPEKDLERVEQELVKAKEELSSAVFTAPPSSQLERKRHMERSRNASLKVQRLELRKKQLEQEIAKRESGN